MGEIKRRMMGIARKMLGKTPAGRKVKVLRDDVYLTSYPRSGNTWTRFLVANLVHPQQQACFSNVEELAPSIHLFSNRWLLRRPRPRLLKSHELYDRRYPKVIYVLRDPRDVAVSMYHYCIKRAYLAENCPIDEFVPHFVAGRFFQEFGTWQQHVTGWLDRREEEENFLLLRYEEMLANTERELERVAGFLHVPGDRVNLEQVVASSSADQMRRLEKQQSGNWVVTRDTRSDKPFVRAAQSGQWRHALSPASVTVIEEAWRETMIRLGYPLSSMEMRAPGD